MRPPPRDLPRCCGPGKGTDTGHHAEAVTDHGGPGERTFLEAVLTHQRVSEVLTRKVLGHGDRARRDRDTEEDRRQGCGEQGQQTRDGADGSGVLHEELTDRLEALADGAEGLVEPARLLGGELVVGLVEAAGYGLGRVGVGALQLLRLRDDVVVGGVGVVEVSGGLVQFALGGTQALRRGIRLRLAGIFLAERA